MLPLATIYPSVNSNYHLASFGIARTPGDMSLQDTAAEVRPLLDRLHDVKVPSYRELHASRGNSGRATTDIAQAARTAAVGAVATLLVDMDTPVPGLLDEEAGAVTQALPRLGGVDRALAPVGPPPRQLSPMTRLRRALAPLAFGLLALVSASGPAARAIGPTPQLTKETFRGPLEQGSEPEAFTTASNAVFFTAKTFATGRELWRSTGPGPDTAMVVDLTPGSADTKIEWMVAVGPLLFFAREDGAHGRELWRSDGSAAGTFLVKDIQPGPIGSLSPYPRTGEWAAFNGVLYFAADDGVTGNELWRSDGTAAGTFLLKDLNLPPFSEFELRGSDPREMTVAGGVLYFLAFTKSHGGELWATTGTAASTSRVADIVPGPDSSAPEQLCAVGSLVFFVASTPATGRELWKSDGSAAGTVLVRDLRPGPDAFTLYELTGTSNGLFFIMDDEVHGTELWFSDGTGSGTLLTRDLAPGPASSSPTDLTALGSRIFFSADDGVSGEELWTSTGDESSTRLVHDSYPGAPGSQPRHLTAALDVLYFFAGTPGQWGLWVYQPGAPSPSLVGPNLAHSNAPMAVIERSVYLAAADIDPLNLDDDAYIHGYEPWRCATPQGPTLLLKDIVPTNETIYPASIVSNGQASLFTIFSEAAGVELWSSDGSPQGTYMVMDIRPGPMGSRPAHLTTSNQILYFLADDGMNGPELWRSEFRGTNAYLVKDIRPGPLGSLRRSSAPWIVTEGGVLFFVADNGLSGMELWSSNGTENGTVLVRDIQPGAAGSNPADLVSIDGTVVFSADDGVSGRELWISDGTEAGTVPLPEIRPGPEGGDPMELTPRRNFNQASWPIYLSADDGSHGRELWKLTPSFPFNLRMVRDIRPGPEGSDPTSLVAGPFSTSELVFSADDGTSGREFWGANQSDAYLILDLVPGPDGSFPRSFTARGTEVFFTAAFGATPEGPAPEVLWKSEGTSFNTTPLTDINGLSIAAPQQLMVNNNRLFFINEAPTQDGPGVLLWRSDGTPHSTARMADLSLADRSTPGRLSEPV